MLPLQQAYEVRQSVLEYIRATFQFKDADVGKAFYRFIEDEKTGLFKGPYVSLKTPFIKAKDDEEIPLEISPSFKPHRHQVQAFSRLTTRDGHQPQPTLLTTGTGSGKTECFLFPVLDYVYSINRYERRQGVKVIIMYPMNALAGDQAKRLAEAIWNDDRLRGKVTAGLFIGEGENPKDYPTQMGEHNIIENRNAIIDTVPDILLTNFKMLDYGLMQQKYMPLWKGNIGVKEPMLRFIVLDELHTYDGAQGTDVANLIRRLKLKLNIPEGTLTPIGTSATIGSGPESKQLLCSYASDVFGEEFTEDSIIEEHRVAVDDFFSEELDDFIPIIDQLRKLDIKKTPSTESYIDDVRKVWLYGCPDDPIEIGDRLRKLKIARDLLKVTSKGVLTLTLLKEQLGRENSKYLRMQREYPEYATIIIESLLALISEAKLPDDSGKPRFPLLFLQIQLWQRELSGIQRFVQAEPEFTWRDAIPRDERIALPIYYCRDCGSSGWLTTKKETENRYSADASRINSAFMDDNKDVCLLNTATQQHEPILEYNNGDLSQNYEDYIHTADLTIGKKGETGVLRVRVASRSRLTQRKNAVLDKKCPLCMSDSLSIVGGRTSTLSSVAVSQIMSSDFDTPDGSRRKMLIFSNSVQDAAHLAGFYEVRTFRFLFRQSIQYYLKQVGHAVSLKELQDGFKKFWKERLQGDEYYYRFMPDEYIEKIDLTKNYRTPSGELSDKFKSEFDLRVDWEICSEFGMMSQLGRTLEKMGSSATFFKEETLQQVFDKIVPWVKENNLMFIADHQDLFLRFVNGILHRLRTRGGVDHEFLRLYRTRELWIVNLNWPKMWDVHFMYKKFGRNRVPHMIGFEFPRGRETILDVTTIRNGRANWFYSYYIKSLFTPAQQVLQPNPEVINDFYIKLLETLTECGVLNKKVANGITNFAISPEALFVEPQVKAIRCERCESRMFVAKSDTLTEDMHCLDYKCIDGVYNQPEDNSDNYYHRVYDREISPRIYAHEHTGLLDRDDRELLEKDFKEHPTPQSTNVLTATSTLEMGIDIGDLNVVTNTGIPPKPSNFLQRVGRAGRKEGSALVLNYAKDGKHDMFYFAEPLSMIEGAVSTPGCFLGARDILRRHFYAFCIDSWTSADTNNIIPPKIKILVLSYALLNDENFFVNRINSFIKEHQVSLMEKFRKQYSAEISTVIDELNDKLNDETFYKRIIDEFEHLIFRIEQIRSERSELKKVLDTIPKNDTERRDEIKNQIRGLSSLERTIKDQGTVEYMTNVGLLPNYAFPETGIKLSATIFAHRAKGDDPANTPEPKSIEMMRSATQGIRELAPGNFFYTQKLKLNINGLSLNERKDGLKEMRYCSDCDAIAIEGTAEYNMNVCPKCGSPSWRTNHHPFLRFATAISSVFREDAAMDDSSDDRDRKLYNTMKHYQFNHSGVVTSYGIKNVAFGIEFCKDVEIYEVNYGSREQMGEKIEVNQDQQISGHGFITCRHCGKSVDIINSNTELKSLHYPYCNHKDVNFPPDDAHRDTFMPLFLYRTMHTEAIKVLLPVQLFDTEASTQLFKAGLELGLRYYYKSSPEHIQIDSYREYNRATQNFDNYLVIYDTIPGGTGYLSKLYDKKEFSRLLQISYEHIRDCECRLEGKDGCYHCILSYGNQWQRENLSRERAEELFRRIVNECDNWEDVNGSIGTITTSGVIEDSELELIFVKAMKRIADDNHWTWERKADAINESYSYALTIDQDGLKVRYNIFPQYRLGPAQGVALATKPDFQFVCTYAEINGKEISVEQVPQWSVYLDGYAFHASEENNGFNNDLKRREAIRTCQNPLRQTWTLTWSDLKSFVKQEDVYGDDIDDVFVATPDPNMLDEFENDLWRKKNSLHRFLFMLTHPDIDVIRREAFSFIASCWTDENQYISSYAHIDEAVEQNARNQFNDITEEEQDDCHFFIKTKFIPRNTVTNGSAWFPYDVEDDSFGDSIRYDWDLRDIKGAINKEEWEDFWRRYNILQFFCNKPSALPAQPEVNLDEILEYFPGLEEIVKQLVVNHVPFDTDGGFQLKEDDIIVAEAAIKIDNKNIVIDDFDDETAARFRSAGYDVFTPETFDIDKIK